MPDEFENVKKEEIAEFILSLNNEVLLSYIFIDIDYCQDLNGRYGHEIGDILIDFLEKTIHEFSKTLKGLGVRTGGDEFVLVSPVDDEIVALQNQKKLVGVINSIKLRDVVGNHDNFKEVEGSELLSSSFASVIFPFSKRESFCRESVVKNLINCEVRMLWDLTDSMMTGIKNVKRGGCVTINYLNNNV